MSGEIFNDGSMLEIFRAEVETHAETLTSGLLSLERDPLEIQQLNEMMRGAHSIKGAARIVGIDPAIRVAHVMEDGFVAAQNGQLSLRPEQIDVLLRGVDFLNRISAASKEGNLDWARYDEDAGHLVTEITKVLASVSDGPHTVSSAPTATSNAATSVTKTESVMADTVTIPVAAFLDAAEAEVVRRAYVAAIDKSVRLVCVDFSQTVDLDATGLSLLAALRAVSPAEVPRVEFVGTGPDLQHVLKVTGIERSPDSGGS